MSCFSNPVRYDTLGTTINYLITNVSIILSLIYCVILGPVFKRFDYGPLENVKIYKSKSPPVYDLSNIKVPVHVYFATNDVFVTPEVTGRRDTDTVVQELISTSQAISYMYMWIHFI